MSTESGRWAKPVIVGGPVLNEFDPGGDSANVRIALRGPAWFGRGMCTEATRTSPWWSASAIPRLDNGARKVEHGGVHHVGLQPPSNDGPPTKIAAPSPVPPPIETVMAPLFLP